MSMALRRVGLLLLTLFAVPCALADEVATIVDPPQFSGGTITGVMPSQLSPEGGQFVTITGTGFAVPARVFVDPGNGSNPG
jgi:IPT/TIG domain